MKTLAPSVKTAVQRQIDMLLEGDAEIITVEELEEKLTLAKVEGKPLRIKQGIDPTSPHVHLGHMVPFRKMRQFQDMGHTGVLIIGDFTAQIGDPTDKSAERTRLGHDETRRNAASYARQIFNVVDESRTEVCWQSSWFTEFNLPRFVDLAGEFSVAHLLSHDTFRKRLAPGFRLSLHELLYPVLQAWDSVQVEADVELGGTDQRFNILCGRDLMRSRGLRPQVAILVQLLPGSDGRKMSKSFGNHIPVDSTASDKIGKMMSVADEFLPEFMRLAAGMPEPEAQGIEAAMGSGLLNPRHVKMDLAKRIALDYHKSVEVEEAAAGFDRVFAMGSIPDDIATVEIGPAGGGIIAIMTDHGLAKSTSEARRLIQQNAVSVDGEKVRDIYFQVAPATGDAVVLKVGKRRFLRLYGVGS
jgi:tyrosyl-tRNA synthetase